MPIQSGLLRRELPQTSSAMRRTCTFPVDAVRTKSPPSRKRRHTAARASDASKRRQRDSGNAARSMALHPTCTPASLGSAVSGTQSHASQGAYRYAIISSAFG